MKKIWIRAAATAAALVLAASGLRAQETGSRLISLYDANGRPLSSLAAGDSLFVGLEGLEPDQTFQVRLFDENGQQVSYFQLTANAAGAIEPSALWYHTGVVGCATRPDEAPGPYRFLTFEEAEQALAGRDFQVAVYREEEEIARTRVPLVVVQGTPRAFFSDATGCLRNSFEVLGELGEAQDVYVTIENLSESSTPRTARLFVVPNRYGWLAGDPLEDFRPEPFQRSVTIPSGETRLTTLAWPAHELVAGAFDLIVRFEGPLDEPVLLGTDLVSWHLDTGTVFQLAYDPPCPTGTEFDIAGRPAATGGWPYFEFHDVFRQGEAMWGAVDPAYVPAGHTGGNYAAYYVIADGSAGGGLVDVSGGVEIVPVKGGCINGSMTRIWNNPTIGDYDVVVDFGNVPASSTGAWVADGTLDAGVDFIDRSTDIGARVVADPTATGPSTVSSWSYAPDPNDANDPLWTDVSSYFNSPDWQVSYSMNQVPLAGSVRYPTGNGPFPLVLVVHGNSSPANASDQGYYYLLNLLASHGMIAVSVDENFLNGNVLGEMDARAIVLLRHLQRWRTWNSTAGHLFQNKVDLTRIGLAGHSRGGEAVTVAWLFNSTLHNAGDPDHNFNFDLDALYAIAPVDGQIGGGYAGLPVTLEDIDYFIMHGSHDGDVSDFQGQKTYDRAHPVTAAQNGIKSLLWVYGANHNFWNTVWQANPDAAVSPAAHLITPAQQQDVGKAFVSAFFQHSLLGRTAYQALFTDDVTFPSLPSGVTLVQQYQDDERLFLNHYEEDDNLATGSLAGILNTNVGNLLSPYVDHAFSDQGNPYWLWQQTDGLVAGWTNSSGTLQIDVPQAVRDAMCTYPYLSFRVGQVYEPTPNLNALGQSQDFRLQLDLGGPLSYQLRISSFDDLPYPEVTTHPWWGNETKTVLKTVRIPFPAFLVNQGSLDLEDLAKILFQFNARSNGLVAIDDIQLTK